MSDAPDWQKVVALTTSVGQVTDAPDWQRIVTAPGGQPVGGGGGSNSIYGPQAGGGALGVTIPWYFGNTTVTYPLGALVLTMFTALVSGTIGNVQVWVETGEMPTADENFLCIYDAGQTTPGPQLCWARRRRGR